MIRGEQPFFQLLSVHEGLCLAKKQKLLQEDPLFSSRSQILPYWEQRICLPRSCHVNGPADKMTRPFPSSNAAFAFLLPSSSLLKASACAHATSLTSTKLPKGLVISSFDSGGSFLSRLYTMEDDVFRDDGDDTCDNDKFHWQMGRSTHTYLMKKRTENLIEDSKIKCANYEDRSSLT